MAQADYVVANGTGAAVRSDLNGQLAAIVSNNSGVTEPSTPYAFQWWADTTTGLLKIRNAANNAFITVGTLADVNLGLLSLAGGTLTGALLADDSGTAALPAIAFDGDPDTGIFRAGANALGIATGGVQRLLVDASGITASSYNGGPLAGFRNLIINGNPNINQRGYVSGAATSGANEYTLDRWRVVTSGQNISFTDSNNVRTVTAPAGGCEQLIEGISIISGTYTLSWTGTATATVGGTAVSNGGNFTLTGGTNATVRFSSGTFSLVQIEPGPVATPFERRPIGTELALCQRYFERDNNLALALPRADQGATDRNSGYYFLKTTKRASPSVSGSGYNFEGHHNSTPITTSISPNGCRMEYTGADFRAEGGVLFAAFVAFEAEL